MIKLIGYYGGKLVESSNNLGWCILTIDKLQAEEEPVASQQIDRIMEIHRVSIDTTERINQIWTEYCRSKR